jgi:dihydroorotase
MTVNPARVLGLDKGTLRIGAEADITIIDPKAQWTVAPEQFLSKSCNTPLGGWRLTGRAEHVIVGGCLKR